MLVYVSIVLLQEDFQMKDGSEVCTCMHVCQIIPSYNCKIDDFSVYRPDSKGHTVA
jgi:hypothetical protein